MELISLLSKSLQWPLITYKSAGVEWHFTTLYNLVPLLKCLPSWYPLPLLQSHWAN